MSKPFDSATKQLVEADPVAWLRYAGLPGTSAELIDADLSTVTSEADRILRVHEPEYIGHIEIQSTYDPDMAMRLLRYNVLAYCRYGLPVQSIVVLLRPQADGPAMTGRVSYQGPDPDHGHLSFRFRAIRVWEIPANVALSGDLTTLPLVPLTKVAPDELPEVIRKIDARIGQEAPGQAPVLWAATYLLMGRRYSRAVVQSALKGITTMQESSTYRALIEEGAAIGRVREARRLLLLLGGSRFGEPDTQTREAIEATNSVATLEKMAERLLEAGSWNELLGS